MKKRFNTQTLVVMAIMVAIQVILSRFLSINAWNMKIGFAFIPIFVTGYLYGPVNAGIVGFVSDIIGASLFPSGKFFPGFTLNAIISGVVMGLFFYKKQDVKRIAGATAVEQLGVSLWLTPLWLHMLFGASYKALIVSRIPQIAVMLVLEPLIMYVMLKVLKNAKIKENLAKNK